MVDIAFAVVERSLVDDSIDESAEVTHVAHLDFLEHLADNLLHLGPHTLGHIGAACCRALLTLELEGATHNGGSHLVGVGALVYHDEVLAACLADNLRVGLVDIDVLADGFPEAFESAGGTSEVDTREVLVGESHLADEGATARKEVHHAVGQACLLVDLHQQIIAQHSRGRRLPDTYVTHQHGAHAEVRCNRGEVERGDGEHEALHSTIGHIVQRALVGARLVAVYHRGVVGVITQEVAEFAGAVDLGLHGGLALTEHRSGIDEIAVLTADKGGDLHHHAGAVNPRRLGPFLTGLHGGGDGGLHLFLAHLVVACENMMILGGHHYFAHILGADLLATDDGGDLSHLVVKLVESFADFFAFRTAGGIAFHRLVLGLRKHENAVVHSVYFKCCFSRCKCTSFFLFGEKKFPTFC